MKTLTFVLFSFLVCSCKSTSTNATNQNTMTTKEPVANATATQQQQDFKLVYTANSRGSFFKIEIANQSIQVVNSRDEFEKPKIFALSDTDWQNIVSEVKLLQYNEIATYKAPSQARFYDGAGIGKFVITLENETYTSKDFDAGNPPVALSKVVSLMISLSNNKQ
ncbi:hypothetical protein [Flavobacterium branchiophilum]|uniref:Lipoprotein n=1 Tax=Flavobacterium branchiophilum TaxID=55197 RepID=A0A2H3KQY8_9FLAO|nr:hypothetical protein [Flavobacterium branchiophilum]PDS24237.1 hypothetical protein B0A77_08865 [Flavobacterium branchiophilum]